MYLKRLLAFLCCFTLVFCLFPSSAFATGGNGNIDGGGGSMGHGTSSNFWNSGNDGVRITVVDASSGTAVSSPLDFSNRTQKTSLLHFGKVNKLQYLSGTGLSLQSGAAYSCIKPAQSMPTIVSSKGQSNIEAIKRYFCSEYACMMVAQAARVDYERMIAGEYKLLIEPIETKANQMSVLSCARFSSTCKPCVWIYPANQREVPVCLRQMAGLQCLCQCS